MVEPPIKKADRKPQPNTEIESPDTSSKPSPSPNFEPPIKAGSRDAKPKEKSADRDRNSGRGKKSFSGDDAKPPISPALARGPKPVKAPIKAEVIESEVETESPTEEAEGQEEPAV